MQVNILSTLLQSFAPLRMRNFRIYMIGQAISLIGTWLQATAQGWVVWELTKSPQALGTVATLSFLPQLILGPFAGVWADRLDRRKILITTQAIAMLLAFALAALVMTGQVQLWHIFVLAALLGIVSALDFPSQQAFIGDLAGMSEIRKAVVLNASVFQSSRIIGPALAGVVVATFGTATAFWLNGLSFLAVIVSLLMVKSNQVRRASGGSPLGEFAEGLRFIRSQPRLMELILSAMFATFFGLAVVITLFPAFAGGILQGDAGTLGALTAASGAGALTSALVVAPLAQTHKRVGVVIGLCSMWAGTGLMVTSRMGALLPAMVSIYFTGLAIPVIITTANGMLQLSAPPDMRARIIAVFQTLSFGVQPIAALFVGTMAEYASVPTAMFVNGALLVLCAASLLLLRKEWREWVVQRAPHSRPPNTTASKPAS